MPSHRPGEEAMCDDAASLMAAALAAGDFEPVAVTDDD